MTILKTEISGLVMVETTPFRDSRGSFYRAYCDEELASLLQGQPVRQINVSHTTQIGAIRGLHFQHPPHAEIKLVRCLRGKIWDVALDLRRGSPTFLHWHGVELSPENHRMMMIPAGCAHGFQVLEPHSELLYLHTATYAPTSEGGIRFDDPMVRISWPLEVTDVSERDLQHPALVENFVGLEA